MKNIKNFEQFNESINSMDWKEEYNEVKCNTLNLKPGDSFEMVVGETKYIDDKQATKKAFYRGKKDYMIYFSYKKTGTVYKIEKSELKDKIIN